MKRDNKPWSEHEDAQAQTLWKQGFSASQVSRMLGTGRTRNAVIGRLNRLGAPGRKLNASDHTSRAHRIAARRRSALKRAPTVKIASIAEVIGPISPPLNFSILALNPLTCRYPLGDPQEAGFAFCGHTCSEGAPYCRDHARLCYQPTTKRQKTATERLAVWLDRRQFKTAVGA